MSKEPYGLPGFVEVEPDVFMPIEEATAAQLSAAMKIEKESWRRRSIRAVMAQYEQVQDTVAPDNVDDRLLDLLTGAYPTSDGSAIAIPNGWCLDLRTGTLKRAQ